MRTLIHSFSLFIIYGYITSSQCDHLPVGLIAQLAEHNIGIVEVMILFCSLKFHYCLINYFMLITAMSFLNYAFGHHDSYLKVLAVFIRHYITTACAIQGIVNWNGELVRSKQTLARFCSKLEFSLALKIAKVVTAHRF